MILIFSIKFDYSTNCVIDWLNYFGVKTVRINKDDNNYKFTGLTKDGIYVKNLLTGEEINLKDAHACWWRRTGIGPHHLRNASTLDGPLQRTFHGMDLSPFFLDGNKHKKNEINGLVEYIFKSIYASCSINLGNPTFDVNRLLVLDIARKHGLAVPEYQIVTNGVQLMNCSKRLGKIVTKAVTSGIYDVIEDNRFYTYTELIEESFLKENENNDFFPSLVTGLIEKSIEIRTFYLDGQFFSMAIFSQSDEKTKIDFRKYTNNRRVPYKLPQSIEQKLRNVFKELALNSGSADLILDKDSNYVFLEINPVGQFDMTSRPCNYNLHKKVANYLMYGKDHPDKRLNNKSATVFSDNLL